KPYEIPAALLPYFPAWSIAQAEDAVRSYGRRGPGAEPPADSICCAPDRSRPAGARRRPRANEDALGMMPDAPPVKRCRFLRASRSLALLTAGALALGGQA